MLLNACRFAAMTLQGGTAAVTFSDYVPYRAAGGCEGLAGWQTRHRHSRGMRKCRHFQWRAHHDNISPLHAVHAKLVVLTHT